MTNKNCQQCQHWLASVIPQSEPISTIQIDGRSSIWFFLW